MSLIRYLTKTASWEAAGLPQTAGGTFPRKSICGQEVITQWLALPRRLRTKRMPG